MTCSQLQILGSSSGSYWHKWDKTGTFSDQISVHIGSQNYLNRITKSPGLVSFCAITTHFENKSNTPDLYTYQNH